MDCFILPFTLLFLVTPWRLFQTVRNAHLRSSDTLAVYGAVVVGILKAFLDIILCKRYLSLGLETPMFLLCLFFLENHPELPYQSGFLEIFDWFWLNTCSYSIHVHICVCVCMYNAVVPLLLLILVSFWRLPQAIEVAKNTRGLFTFHQKVSDCLATSLLLHIHCRSCIQLTPFPGFWTCGFVHSRLLLFPKCSSSACSWRMENSKGEHDLCEVLIVLRK